MEGDSPWTYILALGEHVKVIPVQLQLRPQQVLQFLYLPTFGKLVEVEVDHRRVAGVARGPEQLLKVERERVAREQGPGHGKPLVAGVGGGGGVWGAA